jgi:hypothetical protein
MATLDGQKPEGQNYQNEQHVKGTTRFDPLGIVEKLNKRWYS